MSYYDYECGMSMWKFYCIHAPCTATTDGHFLSYFLVDMFVGLFSFIARICKLHSEQSSIEFSTSESNSLIKISKKSWNLKQREKKLK